MSSSSIVIIYAIRRLGRTGYVYVGSTCLPLESRVRRHVEDAIGKRHSNKELAAIIRSSKNMIIADVLDVATKENRAQQESKYIYKLYDMGHKLCNITDPINPRRKLLYKEK